MAADYLFVLGGPYVYFHQITSLLDSVLKGTYCIFYALLRATAMGRNQWKRRLVWLQKAAPIQVILTLETRADGKQ